MQRGAGGGRAGTERTEGLRKFCRCTISPLTVHGHGLIAAVTHCEVCCCVRRFLKWDDAPCDLSSIGGIKILCEVELGH